MKRRLIGIFLLFLSVVSAAIIYLVSTEQGLRWLFQRAVQMAPGKLSADGVQGRFIGPLEIRGLQYTTETFSASLKSLKLKWKPEKLFFLDLHISELLVDGVRIETFQQEKKPPASARPAAVRLPVNLKIEHGSMTDMTVASFDRPSALVIHEVLLEARFEGEDLEVGTFRVRAPGFDVDLHGTVRPQGDYPMDVEAEWTVDVSDYFPLKGSGSFDGSLSDLRVIQEIHAPFTARLSADVFDIWTDVRWKGALDIRRLVTRTLIPRWPEMVFDGRFKSEGTLSRFDLRGSFRGREDLYVGKIAGEVSVTQNRGDWTLEHLVLTVPSLPSRVRIEGEWAGTPDQKSFRVDTRWDALVWPILEKAEFKSPEGHLNINGSLDRYDIQLGASVAYQDMPISRWKIAGTGDLKHLAFYLISGTLLDGGVSGTGKVRWEPQLAWEIGLEGRDINPESVLAQWPGRIDFSASAEGAPSGKVHPLTVKLHSLKGTLRNRPLSGKAFLNIAGDRYSLSGLNLQLGQARLAASGTLSETWNVQWNFQAETLGDILRGGEGALNGSGSIAGPRTRPNVITRWSGRDLVFEQYAAKEVFVDAAVDPGDSGDIRVDFEGKALVVGFRKIKKISLKGEGKTGSHEITFEVVTPQESVFLFTEGGYRNDTWTGNIPDGRIVSEDFGTWVLKKSDQITISLEKARVPDLCWVREHSRVCVEMAWEGKAGLGGSVRVSGFPLSLLQPALPEGLVLDGTVEGHATATFRDGTIRQGSTHWVGEKGLVSIPLEDEQKLAFGFHRILLEGSVEGRTLIVKTHVLLTDDGFLEGEITLPSAVPVEKPFNPDIQGNLRVVLKHLGFIPFIFPEVQETKGLFKADLVLGGNLYAPSVQGTVSLEDGEASVPRLGVSWREIHVSGEGETSNAFTLEGRLKSGNGEMTFEGDIRLPVSGERSVGVQVRGEAFELIKVPEAWVLASPDLDLQLKGEDIRIRGELKIPEAAIEPRDLSGSVQVSSDVKIVGERQEDVGRAGKHLYSEVRFVLGEKVNFKGFGLNARLSGALKVEEAPETITTGTGEIQILEGEYKAYGQMLEIEKGRLVFADSSVDNPGLDIRAVRKVGEVTTGVTIGGRLQEPRLKLFSIPPMDQADALSYLMLGRPLRQASRSEGKELYNAATSAGIAGGTLLAKKIGTLFGLEQVEVEKGPTQEDTTLFIGKYLSPRIFLAYGVGVFEPVNTLRVRYQMSKHWLFETEHGVETGADLLFKIER